MLLDLTRHELVDDHLGFLGEMEMFLKGSQANRWWESKSSFFSDKVLYLVVIAKKLKTYLKKCMVLCVEKFQENESFGIYPSFLQPYKLLRFSQSPTK